MFRHRSFAIPVALAGFFLMNTLSAPAQAGNGPMAPTEALSILAQARTMDSRCGFLKGAAHDELAGYTARAEIVTAQRMGAKAAEAAVNRGMEAGRKAACDRDGKGFVQDALAAAREAMRQARRAAPARRPVAHRKVVRIKPERNVRLLPAKKAMKERVVALVSRKRDTNFGPVARISGRQAEPRTVVVISRKPESSPRSNVKRKVLEERYVALTAKYYGFLRCGTTNRKALMRLYEDVRRMHYALLRTAGPKVTARAKARAKAMASGRSCGVRIVRR